MDIIQIENDISVFCVAAESFPNGITAAHQKLHGIIPFSNERKYFGISRPEKGIIKYRAAAEKLEQDKNIECESFIIEKGRYRFITVANYREKIQKIGKAFEELLSNSDLDPNGYCIEWYFNDEDVKCMVKIKGN